MEEGEGRGYKEKGRGSNLGKALGGDEGAEVVGDLSLVKHLEVGSGDAHAVEPYEKSGGEEEYKRSKKWKRRRRRRSYSRPQRRRDER